MSSIDGLGALAGSVADDASVQDAMRVALEAQGGSAALGQVSFEHFTERQLELLREALRRQGKHLSESEKRELERANAKRLKSIVEALADRRVLAHRANTRMESRRRDGVTNPRAKLTHVDTPAVLPGGEQAPAAVERPAGQPILADGEVGVGVLVPERTVVLGSALLTAREPMHDRELLLSLGHALLRLCTPSAEQGKRPRHFAGGLPLEGVSGEAHRSPVAPFLPVRLREAARVLGIVSVADLLARLTLPAGRELVSHTLGLPRTVVFLAALRAELLDLPVRPGVAKVPHLKDVITLARIGVGDVQTLAQLGVVLDRHPAKLGVLAALLEAWQRAEPELVGRERITRHELLEWARAAARRGLRIGVARAGVGEVGDHVGDLADAIVAGHLQSRAADPESLFSEVLERLLLQLARLGHRLDRERLSAVMREGDEGQVLRYERRLEQLMQSELRERVCAEELERTQAFREFVYVDADDTLFAELGPWARPDETRDDGLVCFWMEPPPDVGHLRRGTGGGRSRAMVPVYMCLDPQSGSLVPFAG